MFDTGVVTTPGLNMRERPGGKIIDILTGGDRAVILARAQPGKKLWYYVRRQNGRSRRGYVLASDVALDPPESSGGAGEVRSQDGAMRHPGISGFAPLNLGSAPKDAT